MKPLAKDTLISVESYKITDFKTVKNPYEGHYLHYRTAVSKKTETLRFKRRLFSTYKTEGKISFETLEPEAIDSYFNWNEFDGILGQKNISQIMFSKIPCRRTA